MKFLKLTFLPLLLGRSREGAWIEMDLCLLIIIVRAVAPARERGLKLLLVLLVVLLVRSLPRGSVD